MELLPHKRELKGSTLSYSKDACLKAIVSRAFENRAINYLK
jgi:hypothetical protein